MATVSFGFSSATWQSEPFVCKRQVSGDVDNCSMGKRQISNEVGISALDSGDVPMSVRYLLQLIENESPGGAVELRVPPFGAIQCLEGLDHRRGTPPNVIEMAPEVFLGLCLGKLKWESAHSTGQVLASGTLAIEAAKLFPVQLGN